MIPKKIHYVWLGHGEMPKEMKKCLRSWNKYLKDYEITCWNEDNFDINSHHYVKKAYEAKKWAFASDYIRLYALYKYGGIYMDTDVFVIDNFDKLLNDKAFFGFENSNYLFAAVFGVEPHHPLIKELLDYYDNYEFEYDEKDPMKNVNTKYVSDILVNKYKVKLNNKKQKVKDGVVIYPDGILCNPSKDSISIHIFYGSWIKEKLELKKKLVMFVKMRLNNKKKAGLYRKYVSKEK